MTRRSIMALALALTASAPALAQAPAPPPPAPAAPQPVDPDRLEAARALVEIMMPADRHSAMIAGMVEPAMAATQQTMLSRPGLQGAIERNPEARQLIIAFLDRHRTRTAELITASMPGLSEAMAHAYARRFTERQMREIGDFYGSSTGQLFLQQSSTVMGDPEVAAWQRAVLTQSMQGVEAELETLSAELGIAGDTVAPSGRPATGSNLDAMRGTAEPTCVSGDADCTLTEGPNDE